MYLQGLVAGAARVDLDGKAAGEVTARDTEYAAAKTIAGPSGHNDGRLYACDGFHRSPALLTERRQAQHRPRIDDDGSARRPQTTTLLQ
jgi:sRNA-binding protein